MNESVSASISPFSGDDPFANVVLEGDSSALAEAYCASVARILTSKLRATVVVHLHSGKIAPPISDDRMHLHVFGSPVSSVAGQVTRVQFNLEGSEQPYSVEAKLLAYGRTGPYVVKRFLVLAQIVDKNIYILLDPTSAGPRTIELFEGLLREVLLWGFTPQQERETMLRERAFSEKDRSAAVLVQALRNKTARTAETVLTELHSSYLSVDRITVKVMQCYGNSVAPSNESLLDKSRRNRTERSQESAVSLASLTGQLESQRDNIRRLEAELLKLRNPQIEQFNDGLPALVQQQLSEILDDPCVVGVWVEGSTISVLTKTLFCRLRAEPQRTRKRYELGAFWIHLTLNNGVFGSIRYLNTSRRLPGLDNAPHVTSDGSCCLGGFGTTIRNHLSGTPRVDLAVFFALVFIQEVNSNVTSTELEGLPVHLT